MGPADCGSTLLGTRVRTLRSPGPPGAPWFELTRVRTFIQVCMHVHPWFEPLPSSNVSITWGASRHLPGVGTGEYHCRNRRLPQGDPASMGTFLSQGSLSTLPKFDLPLSDKSVE